MVAKNEKWSGDAGRLVVRHQMNRKSAIRKAGHKAQQDLTHSASIQSPFPIFQVKIQFNTFLPLRALRKASAIV
jgi:hypothetical protein